MLRKFLDPQASDSDEPYKERAILVAARFVDALDAKRYSEIWHEHVVASTKEIFAAFAYLKTREAMADSFKLPISEMTQEFFSYALTNNIEGVRTGLWAGVRNSSSKHGWLRPNVNKAQVALLNEGAVVVCPTKVTPLIVPLTATSGESYKVDLETFVIASRTLRVQHFLTTALQAMEISDFRRAINLLEDANRLKRACALLQQHAYQLIFTEQRKTELLEDINLLPQIEPLLAEARALLALDITDALRRDEDETMDFKETMPPAGNNDARKDLAKDFAAFATSGGGKIYFGITKKKQVVGVEEVKTDIGRDEFRKRIDNMCRDNIKPAIRVRIVFIPHSVLAETFIIPVAVIYPGSEPIYYGDGRPYLRRGQSSSLAEPHEVVELIRQYLLKRGWKEPTE